MSVSERFEDLPMFLSPEQVSDCTGIHVKSIRRCLANGTLPGDKVGLQWRIYKNILFSNTWKAVFGDGAGTDGQ